MKDVRESYREAYDKITPSSSFISETFERIHTSNHICSNRLSSFKRKITVLVAATLALVLFTATVFAADYFRSIRLSETLQFSSATDLYAQPIDLSVTHDGLTVTLSEAVYENDKLYITLNYYLEDMSDISFVSESSSSLGVLSIDDGRKAYEHISTISVFDGTSFCMLEYDMCSLQLCGVHEFTLFFDAMDVTYNNGDIKTVKGPWKYVFSLNTSLFDSETVIYEINKSVKLENGDIIDFEQIVCTPLSQRLHYTIIPADVNSFVSYRVEALALDDMGNKYEFVFIEGRNGHCEAVNIYPDKFSSTSENITLNFSITDRYDNILTADESQVSAYKIK